MKKRIVFAVVAILLAVVCVACNVQDPTMISSASSDVVSTAPVAPADSIPDDLDGLAQYLTENEVLAGEKVEMQAAMIGAAKGYKYSVTYNKSSFVVELYEFDMENLPAEAKTVLDSVDKDGTFTMLGTKVEAAHSGKYLMIYADPSEKAANVQHKADALELLRLFGERA